MAGEPPFIGIQLILVLTRHDFHELAEASSLPRLKKQIISWFASVEVIIS
jgi:hypothetical protein